MAMAVGSFVINFRLYADILPVVCYSTIKGIYQGSSEAKPS